MSKKSNLPDYVDAYYGRGVAKGGLDDYEGAIADYDRAIELKPEEAKAYDNREYIRVILDDYHGAIADYDWAALEPPTIFLKRRLE